MKTPVLWLRRLSPPLVRDVGSRAIVAAVIQPLMQDVQSTVSVWEALLSPYRFFCLFLLARSCVSRYVR